MLQPSVEMGGEFLEFEELLEERFPTRRICSAQEIVYGHRERDLHVHYYIKRGNIDSYILHENGGAVNLSRRGRGAIFPLYFSWNNTSVEMTVESVAVEECSFLVMPKRELHNLMLEVPELAIAMIDAHAKFSTFLDYSLASQLFDPLSVRICNSLYLLLKDNGQVQMTHEKLAQSLNASRANVTRVLNDLRKLGVIDIKRGSIFLLKPDELLDRCSYIVRGH